MIPALFQSKYPRVSAALVAMKSPESGVTPRDAAREAAIAHELAVANQGSEPLRAVVEGLFEAPPQPDDEFMRFSMAAYHHLGISDDVRLFMGRLWADSMQSWATSERAHQPVQGDAAR